MILRLLVILLNLTIKKYILCYYININMSDFIENISKDVQRHITNIDEFNKNIITNIQNTNEEIINNILSSFSKLQIPFIGDHDFSNTGGVYNPYRE